MKRQRHDHDLAKKLYGVSTGSGSKSRDWIQTSHECIISGKRDLYSRLPNAISAIIEHDIWCDFTNRHTQTFASFTEFVTDELELTVDELREFCKNDDECMQLLDWIDAAESEWGDR